MQRCIESRSCIVAWRMQSILSCVVVAVRRESDGLATPERRKKE